MENIEDWISSEPLALRELRVKVVFLDSWPYCCISCVRALPHMRELHAKHSGEAFVVMEVRTPGFPFERKPENIERAVASASLKYPISLDGENTAGISTETKIGPGGL